VVGTDTDAETDFEKQDQNPVPEANSKIENQFTISERESI
jgi:hypothetical protein